MSLFDKTIANLLPIVPKPVVGYFSRPYIAGDSLEDALKVIKDLNEQGFRCAVDILGEYIERIEESKEPLAQYKETLAGVVERKLDCNLSMKMTQLGMGIDDDVCLQNMREIVGAAREKDTFVRIDMEDSSYTTRTLGILGKLRDEFNNVGIVIQAYLRRSAADIDELVKKKTSVRLCKGIYVEPRSIAYKDRDIIRKNYVLLLEKLLRGGCYVGIATHDEMLVWEAYRLISELGLSTEEYEFQMLLGVQEPLRKIVLGDGHNLRVYVPYGKDWYGYSVRRLKENPEIAGHVMRNILSSNNEK